MAVPLEVSRTNIDPEPNPSPGDPRLDSIPYRLALAGGWIDQPFVSRHNPAPPGSMVVVGIDASRPFWDRAGMATGTRKVAARIWNGRIPPATDDAARQRLVRALYEAENRGLSEPSGSQDMIGLIYPGICRLDYDASVEGGLFPRRIECCVDPTISGWVQRVIHIVPVEPRPDGYNPLGEQNLDPEWVVELGRTGRACWDAILSRDVRALGQSMNRCMQCWEAILPQTVRHPALRVDLPGVLATYQNKYPGAMFSGCGGGYLYVASEEPVPDSFNIRVRL